MSVRPRLLLVDDDQRVLEGWRRGLGWRARGWELELARGPEVAAECLEDARYDVVVVGLSVVEPGGRETLRYVSELQPWSLRLLAVRQGERREALSASGLAHQLAHRSDLPELLGDAIERALGVRELLADVQDRIEVHEIGGLPSPPKTYLALGEVLSDPEFTLDDVATVVEKDAALTAKLLQIANSPYFGLVTPATSVRKAAAHLGVDLVRTLCLSAEVFARFEHELPEGFSFDEQERHARVLCEVLVSLVPDRATRERVLLAALLHDVGVLIQVCQRPQRFTAVQRMTRHSKLSRSEIERRLLGVTHAELGAYLLGTWGLPYDVVEAIAYHHEPSLVGARELGVLGWLHVADVLVEEVDGGLGGAAASKADTRFLRDAGVTPDKVRRWRRVVREHVQPSGAVA